jgi:GNAT superfamily N-acetyltransferase
MSIDDAAISDPAIEVREATVEEILPLRKAVLRPMEPIEPSPYDGYPDVHHFAAFIDGVVIGCATVLPSAYEGLAGGSAAIDSAWQLRGMAVEPGRQGQGIGRSVLTAAIDFIRASGAPALWANARTTALPFYEAMGFAVIGDEFIYGPSELPHYRILLLLRP